MSTTVRAFVSATDPASGRRSVFPTYDQDSMEFAREIVRDGYADVQVRWFHGQPTISLRKTDTLHRRWTTVLDGELKGWVGVSDATLAEFQRGVVHGRQVEADGHCTTDCPGCADSPYPLGWR